MTLLLLLVLDGQPSPVKVTSNDWTVGWRTQLNDDNWANDPLTQWPNYWQTQWPRPWPSPDDPDPVGEASIGQQLLKLTNCYCEGQTPAKIVVLTQLLTDGQLLMDSSIGQLTDQTQTGNDPDPMTQLASYWPSWTVTARRTNPMVVLVVSQLWQTDNDWNWPSSDPNWARPNPLLMTIIDGPTDGLLIIDYWWMTVIVGGRWPVLTQWRWPVKAIVNYYWTDPASYCWTQTQLLLLIGIDPVLLLLLLLDRQLVLIIVCDNDIDPIEPAQWANWTQPNCINWWPMSPVNWTNVDQTHCWRLDPMTETDDWWSPIIEGPRPIGEVGPSIEAGRCIDPTQPRPSNYWADGRIDPSIVVFWPRRTDPAQADSYCWTQPSPDRPRRASWRWGQPSYWARTAQPSQWQWTDWANWPSWTIGYWTAHWRCGQAQLRPTQPSQLWWRPKARPSPVNPVVARLVKPVDPMGPIDPVTQPSWWRTDRQWKPN